MTKAADIASEPASETGSAVEDVPESKSPPSELKLKQPEDGTSGQSLSHQTEAPASPGSLDASEQPINGAAPSENSTPKEDVAPAPPVDPVTQLSDRVNALVKAILDRLVPETQRIASALSNVEDRSKTTESEVLSIANYAQKWTEDLIVAERKRTARAYDEIFQLVIYPLHDQMFTKICAMESGQQDPEPSLLNLMQNLEGSLDRLDVVVLRPQPGEKLELGYMETLEAVPCRFFRRPDTVARVHRCGFALRHGEDDELTMMRKALVDVYRKI